MIGDALFMRLLGTARRGENLLHELSDPKYGNVARGNHHFLFSVTSESLLHANNNLSLGVQIQPAYFPQRV